MDSNTTGKAQPAYAQPVDLDAAIDTVAREMTGFEPSGALKARVLDRIEQGRRRSPFALSRWAWAGAAAAAVLALATAVWVARPVQEEAHVAVTGQQPTAPSLVAASAEPRASQPAGIQADAAFIPTPSGAATRPGRSATAPGTRVAPPAETREELNVVPAMADIEPLTFAEVAPGPLQVAAVTVAPLPAMTSIDIPSLDPGSNDASSADSKKEK
jgi:hypothetical protein